MRMTALAIMGLLVCCASLYAQQGPIYGSGRIIEASLPASNFNRVDMAAIGNVHIKQDTREELRIKVDDNLLPYFKTMVVDGVLVIYIDPPVSLQPTQPPEFDLSVLALQEIRLSGAANIDAPHLAAEQFAVTLTGTGNVALADFSATRLTVLLAGTGNVILAGRVEEQAITLSGSGSYQAGTLTSTTAAIRLSGVGNAELQVSDVLQAEIWGAGTIRYRGHPRTVQTSVIGAGTIIAVE
jgi:Putative auto-transporter adhesin, head GIN domain